MKLWYMLFILTFIMLYGSLSIVILGSWAYETAKVLRVRRPLSRRTAR
jgi:hypothetical protein